MRNDGRGRLKRDQREKASGDKLSEIFELEADKRGNSPTILDRIGCSVPKLEKPLGPINNESYADFCALIIGNPLRWALVADLPYSDSGIQQTYQQFLLKTPRTPSSCGPISDSPAAPCSPADLYPPVPR
jgi:hypothetical protein